MALLHFLNILKLKGGAGTDGAPAVVGAAGAGEEGGVACCWAMALLLAGDDEGDEVTDAFRVLRFVL